MKITKDIMFQLMPYTAEKLDLLGVKRLGNRKGWIKKLIGKELNPELEKYLTDESSN